MRATIKIYQYLSYQTRPKKNAVPWIFGSNVLIAVMMHHFQPS